MRNELKGLRKEIESGELESTSRPLPVAAPDSAPLDSTAGSAETQARPKRSQLWIGLAVATLVVGLAVIWTMRPGPDRPLTKGEAVAAQDPDEDDAATAAPETPSIAVLPFADMSAEQDQEYFTDGLAEELLNALARVPGLRVAARTSSFQFKGQTGNISEIGEKLHVGAVLEGSVRKAGNQVRITAQLVDVADGFHLWSQTYDRQLDDIFAVQEDIAASVVEAMQVTLLGDSAATVSVHATSPEAYNAYLQGRFFLEQRVPGTEAKAVEYFRQAIELDPDYAPAWAALGDALNYFTGGIGGLPFEEGFEQARQAAHRALELDADLAEAYAVLGHIHAYYDWDWRQAMAAFDKALELSPNNVSVLNLAASRLVHYPGRTGDALAMARLAVSLDPLNLNARNSLAHVLYHTGEFDEMEVEARRVLEVNPNHPGGLRHLGMSYIARGEAEKALELVDRFEHPFWRHFALAVTLTHLGRHDEAQEPLDWMIREHAQDAAYQIAEIYALRGDLDESFAWLERAYLVRDPGLGSILTDPNLAGLAGDPRWTALLAKLGFSG